MEKIDNYMLGYRAGIRFALLNCMNLFKDSKSDKLPLDMFLLALYRDLDEFIKYGDCINFYYTRWDKKGKPTEVKASHLKNYQYLQEKKVKTIINGLLELGGIKNV